MFFPDTQAPLLFNSLFFFVTLHADVQPAQTTTVGAVMRVRGIKNKDINPVASLSLQGGQAQICQGASEAPLSLLRHALLVSWVWPKQGCLCTMCLGVCVCVCAAAPIYKYLPSGKASSHTSASIISDSKLLRKILTQTVSWSRHVTCRSTVTHPCCRSQQSNSMVQFDVNIPSNTFK